MNPWDSNALHFWELLTRLGEAQILLPAALLAAGLLARRAGGQRLAAWWLGLLMVAVLLTTLTKVAFIGWGVGWQALDFTGVSGHSMFAAAIYPLLLGSLAPSTPRFWRGLGVVAGAALALIVGWSRLAVHAHSASEVVAGLLLGGAVSAAALLRAPMPGAGLRPWAPALVALWLAAMPAYAPPSQTHPMVTRLALALSGRSVPHTRAEFRGLRAVPLSVEMGGEPGG